MKPDPERPPIYKVWEEVCGWTFDRTSAIPKSQRFTFGQKIDESGIPSPAALSGARRKAGQRRGAPRGP